MKKILMLLLGVAMVGAVKAQEIPDRKMEGPGMHDGMHKRAMKGRHDRERMMMKDLNLTEEQRQQLKKNREDLRTRLEALKKEDNITVKEYRSRMEKLKEEQKNSFQSILTEEQKARIEKNKADAKGRFAEMDRKRAEQMKTRLGLTDDQASQFKKNREELQSRIKAIREDKSLNEEKKREAIREQMKELKKKNNSILTEEQKNKMKEMHHKGDLKGRKPEDKKTV